MRFGGFFRRHDLHTSPWAVRAYRAVRRGAAALGFDLVLKTFYSPIPDLRQLPTGILERRSSLPGIDFDLDRQIAWLERDLAPHMSGFRPPSPEAAPPGTYARGTVSYTELDAAVLHAMLRRLRPRRVLELGSGASTLVMAEALRANASEGSPGRLESYDPYPAPAQVGLDGLDALHRTRAQDVPLSAFEALEDGDVLFVDTTHTVKLGGDVNFIVLDVLPRLAPGVVVHVHDVFLPYEYPRQWVEDFGLYWGEQYLLQAFLAENRRWLVLCGVAALCRDRRERLGRLAAEGLALDGSAFWIRRLPAQPS